MSEINVNRAPVKLTVTGILADLSQGLTRPEIRSKYALSAGDMTSLFQHPSLKGRKPAKLPGFILTDDTVIGEVQLEPVSQNASDSFDLGENKTESIVDQVVDQSSLY